MAKVQIVGIKRFQDQTVQLLGRLGVIQIDEWSESRALSQQRMALSDEAVQMRQRIVYAATRVDAILASLPVCESLVSPDYEDLHVRPQDWLIQSVEADLAEIGPPTQALVVRHDQLEAQLASFARYEATLEQLLPIVPGVVDLENYATSIVWVERRFQAALEVITHQLEELTDGQCEVISREVSHDVQAAVLVFPKAQAKSVAELLGRENISQVRLPTELAGQSFQQAQANMHRRLETIPGELAEIERQQEALARAWRPRLLTWQALLPDQLAEIDVCTDFGQTDYTFVVEGWVPECHLAGIEAAIRQEIGDQVIVTPLPLNAEEKKQAPVMFDNRFFARPFEPLVGLLALPKYGTIDPTPLMSLFFPLFFGMMLGDIAYGAILLAIMIYLRRRFYTRPTARRLTEVLIMGSVWAIVFGFIYGEFLGTFGEKQLGLTPLWFNRGPDSLVRLFLLAIGVGAGHVVLGLCRGLWAALRRRNRHLALEKAAMLVSLCGLFLLVAVLAHLLPAAWLTPATAVIVVGLAVLIYSFGSMGALLAPLELLGTLGNILSYLRIAAIGLSSVYLAEVASELAAASSVVLGIIVATFFHSLNIAMGAFSPTIHSLRLHYVEFFTKFYEGGGRAFRPFQRSVKHRDPAATLYLNAKGG